MNRISMDISSTCTPLQRPGHKRSKSSSVLKSIMSPKGHSRTRSITREQIAPFQQIRQENQQPFDQDGGGDDRSPHRPMSQRVLGEIRNSNGNSPHSRKSIEKSRAANGIREKTLSMVSLQSITNDKDRSKSRDKKLRKKDDDSRYVLKKTKSATSLSEVLAKAKQSFQGDRNDLDPKGKENTTPPSSAYNPPVRTPIWEQFVSTPMTHEVKTTTQVPLNDHVDNSPSKQRNFPTDMPTLNRRERPKSETLAKATRSAPSLPTLMHSLEENAQNNRNSTATKTSAATLKSTRSTSRDFISIAKRGTKVMAAVAALNNKVKESTQEASMDPKQIDAAFEAVLDSRNIPENMREKMRALKTSVKVDFIRSNEVDGKTSELPKQAIATTKGKISTQIDGQKTSDSPQGEESPSKSDKANSTKRARPRSRTFTFSKGSFSAAKKHKVEADMDTVRPGKSIDLPKSPSTTSLGKKSGSSFFKSSKPAVPEEFVSYLRTVQHPEVVEVGKIHKLRQLLRNETVSWVDTFIRLGGMGEIVGLLHRIMEVEWREEHEDQLLHETLLCLKALCTTDFALQKLCEIEKTLFPALLGMLFDPEHKGPSEFTTRAIVINLLFVHLAAAVKDPKMLLVRVASILSYVTDPTPPDEKKPVSFILSMRVPRPYRIWCREVSNVSKEVFWIFLHNLNVVALPPSGNALGTKENSASSAASFEQNLGSENYTKSHFPQPRPPVPAAPYVGGVEWDATNYLASHLDLLNGVIASLPTKAERNGLREELRASGFEKIMGGMLRTCKEKFYDNVHDGLRTWVAAAVTDGWDVRDVRMGPKLDPATPSPRKSPIKKVEKPPMLEAPPKLDLGLGLDDLKTSGQRKEQVKDWF